MVVKMMMMMIQFYNSVITGLSMATSHIPAWLVHSLLLFKFFLCIFINFLPDVTFSYSFRCSQQTFLVLAG